MNIGSHGVDRRLPRAEIANSLVGLLFRNRISFKKILPASCSNLSELLVRLRILQVCPGLLELLINLRSFDLCQELTLFNMRSDVNIPMLQIAVGASIDWSVVKGLRVSRQHYLL